MDLWIQVITAAIAGIALILSGAIVAYLRQNRQLESAEAEVTWVQANAQIRDELEKLRVAREADRDRFEEDIKNIRHEHAEQLMKLRREYEDKIAILRRDYSERYEQLRSDNGIEIAALKLRVKALEEERTNLIISSHELNKVLDQLQKRLDKLTAEKGSDDNDRESER